MKEINFLPSLLTAKQVARQVYGVSERTFHNLRAQGLVPDPVVLGPRSLRWIRHECEEHAMQLPRKKTPIGTEPSQLLRARIERMKEAQ